MKGSCSAKLGGDPLFIVNPRSANGMTRRRFLRELSGLKKQFPSLGDLGRAEFVGLTWFIHQGMHVGRPKIHTTRGRVVEVTADRPLLVDLDGEQPGTTPVRAEILPGALTALCPACSVG